MGSNGLANLIAANAPYWAAEAEIVRSYWTAAIRTRETDAKWLLHQCYKEYWDGFIPPFNRLSAEIHEIDISISREAVLVYAETLAEEFAHYCAFAEVYEALRTADEPAVSPALLKARGNWEANMRLVALRREHKERHGELGRRAHFFTEGGYCTLYAEGMRRAGHGEVDELIAKACGLVYDDEFGHMLLGIAGLADASMDAQEWQLLATMTVEQMKGRLHMRNAQFSYPVSELRLHQMLAGSCEPMAFDWQRAGLADADSAQRLTVTA